MDLKKDGLPPVVCPVLPPGRTDWTVWNTGQDICALTSHKVPLPAKDGVQRKFATACSERQQSGFHEVVCPRPQEALGVTDSGGFSSSITLLWPRLTAYISGVWPSLSGLPRLTSFRPSSIFTTPSYPSAAA